VLLFLSCKAPRPWVSLKTIFEIWSSSWTKNKSRNEHTESHNLSVVGKGKNFLEPKLQLFWGLDKMRSLKSKCRGGDWIWHHFIITQTETQICVIEACLLFFVTQHVFKSLKFEVLWGKYLMHEKFEIKVQRGRLDLAPLHHHSNRDSDLCNWGLVLHFRYPTGRRNTEIWSFLGQGFPCDCTRSLKLNCKELFLTFWGWKHQRIFERAQVPGGRWVRGDMLWVSNFGFYVSFVDKLSNDKQMELWKIMKKHLKMD